jgi:hypothetical protein
MDALVCRIQESVDNPYEYFFYDDNYRNRYEDFFSKFAGKRVLITVRVLDHE